MRGDLRGDGDGWVECAEGHRHWGRHGAAGLLLWRRQRAVTGEADQAPEAADEVLLQHRAEWSHHGGTWGIPGGARDSSESTVAAALREAGEEAGIDAERVRVTGLAVDDHGGWSYTTVLAEAASPLDARPTGGESIDVRWEVVADVECRALHPGFASAWPALRDGYRPLRLVVDAANVVGSRPDGWWRDRVGAARRLHADLARLLSGGIPPGALPADVAGSGLDLVFPQTVLVVEGAARVAADDVMPAAAPGDVPAVALRVVAAAGSGDDEIVRQARVDNPAGAEDVLVVTADRALRERVRAVGAVVTGPRWLTGLLDR